MRPIERIIVLEARIDKKRKRIATLQAEIQTMQKEIDAIHAVAKSRSIHKLSMKG